MIDTVYKVRRYITEFCTQSDELIAEYELSSFDLKRFQSEFGEKKSSNPMFDCYQIKESNIEFLNEYMNEKPDWDLLSKTYFVEVETL